MDVPVTVTVLVPMMAPSAGELMATVGAVRSTVKVELSGVLVLPAASVAVAVTVYVSSARGPGSAKLQLPEASTLMGP
ncbi:hypothetical protein COEX109129_12130 [Corallococcus exiguus]